MLDLLVMVVNYATVYGSSERNSLEIQPTNKRHKPCEMTIAATRSKLDSGIDSCNSTPQILSSNKAIVDSHVFVKSHKNVENETCAANIFQLPEKYKDAKVVTYCRSMELLPLLRNLANDRGKLYEIVLNNLINELQYMIELNKKVSHLASDAEKEQISKDMFYLSGTMAEARKLKYKD